MDSFNAISTAISVHFAPVLPMGWMIAIALAAAIFLLFSLYKKRKGGIMRALSVALFILALCNPSVLEENRKAVKDVVAVVVDESPSTNYGQRRSNNVAMLEYLSQRLNLRDDVELRIIKAGGDNILANETELFKNLDIALADVPKKRRAGVVFLSDGQIHDVPRNLDTGDNYGPIHLLLNGSKDEKDRQLVITEAPSYGIVGKEITVKYRVEDTKNIGQKVVRLTIREQNAREETIVVPIGEDLNLDLKIEHAGQNVFELSVEDVNGEITPANNKAALLVNGVRERLRVLLVSGQPHAGGRTWRDLLTSDPSVDLVHFTILREPSKLDATPQNELSLIAFPFRELFEVKLYDFDLIVFDRYKLNRILPDFYFKNISDYIRKGGAFLEASGPAFAGRDSIYFTALMDVFPGTPTGEIIQKPFRPSLTDIGKQHPVTGSLVWKGMSAGATTPQWGSWLRQIELNQDGGQALLNGANDFPLLLLDRVEDGRVAQLASDHIWLWSRGYQEGGPHTELLRRIVHWLMKEPELDERALDLSVNDTAITIKSRDFTGKNSEVLMTKPDGSTQALTLNEGDNGIFQTQISADQIGIYSFEDSYGESRFIVVGDLNPPELRGVISTADKMKPLIEVSNGGALWMEDTSRPDIRFLSADRRSYAGTNWIGLRQNNEYSVQGVQQKQLIPEWMMLSLLLGMVILTWWIEGRAK